MTKETKIHEVLGEAGYKALPNKAIVVKYAPQNLSATITNFFTTDYYVLQICEDALVMVPFGKFMGELKKEVALEIPIASIESVDVAEDILNYKIAIATDDSLITLTAQQKELSGMRTSGLYALESKGLEFKNWHEDNLDGTLASLRALKDAPAAASEAAAPAASATTTETTQE